MPQSRKLSEVQRSQVELFLEVLSRSGRPGAIPGCPGGPSAMEIAITGDVNRTSATGSKQFIRVSEDLGYSVYVARRPTTTKDLAWVSEAFDIAHQRPLHPVWSVAGDGTQDVVAKYCFERYEIGAAMTRGRWLLPESGFGAPAMVLVRATKIRLRELHGEVSGASRRRWRSSALAGSAGIAAGRLADAVVCLLGQLAKRDAHG